MKTGPVSRFSDRAEAPENTGLAITQDDPIRISYRTLWVVGMEAREFVRSTVGALARCRVATKLRAVEAVLFDDREPSLRSVARAHKLPTSTLHDLVGRVKERARRDFRR